MKTHHGIAGDGESAGAAVRREEGSEVPVLGMR